MYTTLFAIFLSFLALFFDIPLDSSSWQILAVSLGFILIFIITHHYGLLLSPVHNVEQEITPRLVEIFRKDFKLNGVIRFLFIWFLFLIGIALTPFKYKGICIFILTGIGLDAILYYFHRSASYLDPFQVVDFLKQEADKAIEQDHDAKLCDLIEAISEVGIKSIHRSSSALTNHVIDCLDKLGEGFLASVKRLSHPTQNPELMSQGVKDTLSYLLLFLLQHLSSIQGKVLERNMELVAGHIITTLSKIITYAARVDLSLTALPLHYMQKATLSALKQGFSDAGVKGIMGLLEVFEAISKTKDLAYQEIKIPLITLITTLEEISKEMFRQDKQIKFQILKSPFLQMAQSMENEPLKGHRDTPFLIQQINRILGEFQALEAVMNTIPPLPNLSTEEETQKE